MNDIYSVDLTRTLPISLKNDPKMIALARVISDEMLKTSKLIKNNIIYPRIDELSEDVLDILAYDLHVDWYEYDYPIDVKRAIIKDSVKVHKRLGTGYAVELALGSLHPNSEIEEWDEYGGKPFYFRIVLDTTQSRVEADYFQVVRAIEIYKRKSAHLDDLIYQCNIGVQIETEEKKSKYTLTRAGQVKVGEYPQHNRVGAAREIKADIETGTERSIYNNAQAGTKPQRNRISSINDIGVQIEKEERKSKYALTRAGQVKAGERPQRNRISNVNNIEVQIEEEEKKSKYALTRVGRVKAGEWPQRNRISSINKVEVEAQQESEHFMHTNQVAGTKPQRNRMGNLDTGGVEQEVKGEAYGYKIKKCGTSICGK